jgi:excisionase family DNA binding protein
MGGDGDSILTLKQVAEMLQVSEGWLYKKARAKIIPHIRIGGMIRFTKMDIDDWMDAHKYKGCLKV